MEIYGIINEKGNYEMTPEQYSQIMKDLEDVRSERDKLTEERAELRMALLKATRKNKMKTKDVELKPELFVNMYNSVQALDDFEKDIYGKDITVHWHGLYCNCSDGPEACDYIMDSLEQMVIDGFECE